MRLALITAALVLATLPTTTAAQTQMPRPRPFPGAPAPPSPTAPAPAPNTPPPSTTTPPPASGSETGTPPVTSPTQASVPQAPPSIGPDLPGVPAVYPTAQYLEAIDAGAGQTYHLYGADATFEEVVTYYRTVMRNGGREIYRTPGVHQFDLGRFDDNRMAYPPSVVVKDYAGGESPGYLFVNGTEEKRFRTIIQVVPPDPGNR